MSHDEEAFLRTLRFVAGELNFDDRLWWRSHAGSRRVPKRTAPAVRRFLRDLYLERAHRLFDGDTRGFLQAWEAFVARGPYKTWRDDEQPPEGAADLHVCLFHATKLNRGETLCEKHLAAVVGTNL